MEQAKGEALKQLEGKEIAPDQCYDFVFRSVVFRYYPYREFASLAEVRRVFPEASLPETIDGCGLLSAALTSLDYNEMAVETLPSSDRVGQIYDLPPRAEPISYARLTYRADDSRRILLNVADKTHMPAVVEELFQYDGRPCVLSDLDSRDGQRRTGQLHADGGKLRLYHFSGHRRAVVEGKTGTLVQALTPDEARALLEKIPFDDIVLGLRGRCPHTPAKRDTVCAKRPAQGASQACMVGFSRAAGP